MNKEEFLKKTKGKTEKTGNTNLKGSKPTKSFKDKLDKVSKEETKKNDLRGGKKITKGKEDEVKRAKRLYE